jgi:precorrin-8X/cobalt-precorrin-8 methylmutase
MKRSRRMEYIKDPEEIVRRSFAAIRAATDLSSIPHDLEPVALRLVHTTGDPGIVQHLAFSPEAGRIGSQALAGGAAILTDCEMVASGISRGLRGERKIICTLNDASVPALAKKLGTTRSAAAVELWKEHLAGAIVAIGNAPTTLFHLLERLEEGWPAPALILGFPVGFIGAAESKEELIARPFPYIALRGRRGGSPLAATAVNALLGAKNG